MRQNKLLWLDAKEQPHAHHEIQVREKTLNGIASLEGRGPGEFTPKFPGGDTGRIEIKVQMDSHLWQSCRTQSRSDS
jgi:hypothetical protein